MKVNEFAQLLQNELILPRDPHLADRFAALLDENYEPVAPKEPTPADGVNVVEEPSVADPTLVTEPIPVTDPAMEGTSSTELAPVTAYSTPVDTPALESKPPDYAGKAMDEEANAIQESEAI